jgi:hypothetical protein
MVLIFGPQFLPVFNPVSWLYGHATDIVLTIIMRL